MTLSGHNPLVRIDIRGTPISNPRGLVVVVGANCSGKTQLLQDIQKTIAVEGTPYVVVKDIAVLPPPDFDQFLDQLISEKYVRRDPGNPANSIRRYPE
jgi:hypothetical protein